jgi:DNA-binding NarL/FixJ family response regulator
VRGKTRDVPAKRCSPATDNNPERAITTDSKRARRTPRLIGRPKPNAPPVKLDPESDVPQPEKYRPASVDEAIAIFSRRPDWPNIKLKFAARLRAAGVPEESLESVTENAIRTIIECQRKSVDAQTVKWAFAWDVLSKYIFPCLSEAMKKRFRLYSERVGTMKLTPRERQISFYVVWGLANKEIAEKIGTKKDNVNKHVQKIRRKLGIGPVCADDRLNTVLNLLGL